MHGRESGNDWSLLEAVRDVRGVAETRSIGRHLSSLLVAPVADGMVYGSTGVELAGLGEVRVSTTEGGFIPSSGELPSGRTLVDKAKKFLGSSLAVPVARPNRGSVLVRTARDVALTVADIEPSSLLFPIRQPCLAPRD
jgi:hypothetical protein